jgi:aromatic ring-cleaving dioxygenase
MSKSTGRYEILRVYPHHKRLFSVAWVADREVADVGIWLREHITILDIIVRSADIPETNATFFVRQGER